MNQIGSTVIDIQNDKGEEQKTEIQLEAESFSVYGVVYTVDFRWEVNGKTYEFSIPGGGFVSLQHFVEALGIEVSDTEDTPDDKNDSPDDINDTSDDINNESDDKNEPESTENDADKTVGGAAYEESQAQGEGRETSGTNGNVKFERVPVGTYYMKEESAPND